MGSNGETSSLIFSWQAVVGPMSISSKSVSCQYCLCFSVILQIYLVQHSYEHVDHMVQIRYHTGCLWSSSRHYLTTLLYQYTLQNDTRWQFQLVSVLSWVNELQGHEFRNFGQGHVVAEEQLHIPESWLEELTPQTSTRALKPSNAGKFEVKEGSDSIRVTESTAGIHVEVIACWDGSYDWLSLTNYMRKCNLCL